MDNKLKFKFRGPIMDTVYARVYESEIRVLESLCNSWTDCEIERQNLTSSIELQTLEDDHFINKIMDVSSGYNRDIMREWKDSTKTQFDNELKPKYDRLRELDALVEYWKFKLQTFQGEFAKKLSGPNKSRHMNTEIKEHGNQSEVGAKRGLAEESPIPLNIGEEVTSVFETKDEGVRDHGQGGNDLAKNHENDHVDKDRKEIQDRRAEKHDIDQRGVEVQDKREEKRDHEVDMRDYSGKGNYTDEVVEVCENKDKENVGLGATFMSIALISCLSFLHHLRLLLPSALGCFKTLHCPMNISSEGAIQVGVNDQPKDLAAGRLVEMKHEGQCNVEIKHEGKGSVKTKRKGNGSVEKKRKGKCNVEMKHEGNSSVETKSKGNGSVEKKRKGKCSAEMKREGKGSLEVERKRKGSVGRKVCSKGGLKKGQMKKKAFKPDIGTQTVRVIQMDGRYISGNLAKPKSKVITVVQSWGERVHYPRCTENLIENAYHHGYGMNNKISKRVYMKEQRNSHHRSNKHDKWNQGRWNKGQMKCSLGRSHGVTKLQIWESVRKARKKSYEIKNKGKGRYLYIT